MSEPILIIGGGIGGMAAALALANKGIASHVIEAADALREVGAGIQIAPNALRMLDRLGVLEAIKHVAAFPESINLRDALSGERVFHLKTGEEFVRRFQYPYAVIYRPDLHNTLIEACRARPALVEITLNEKIVSFTQDSERVTAVSASGRTFTGPALIGADGLWSATRAQIIGDGKPRVSGHIAYRAVLPLDQVPASLARTEVTLWAGPKTHLVHYPLRRGELFNLVAVFHSNKYDEGWDTFGDVEELNQRFAGQRPEVLELLAKIETWKMWVLCDREPAKDWSQGRATLLGDAAHPMLQYLAQGASMALEDAVVLADKIVDYQHDYARAFIAYQQARYLRTARVQLTARFYGDIYHAAGATRDLRNAMLSGNDPTHYETNAWLYDGI